MIAKKILAIILLIVIAAIVVAVLAALAFFHDYEHTKCRCENCKYYDNTLHVCWPRFEERFAGDKGCDFFKERDYEK